MLVWSRTIRDHTELRASFLRFNKEAMAQLREIDARHKAGMAQLREIEFTTPHSQATNTPEDFNTGGEIISKPSDNEELEDRAGISVTSTPEYYNTGGRQSPKLLMIRGIQAMMPLCLHQHQDFRFVIASMRFTPSVMPRSQPSKLDCVRGKRHGWLK